MTPLTTEQISSDSTLRYYDIMSPNGLFTIVLATSETEALQRAKNGSTNKEPLYATEWKNGTETRLKVITNHQKKLSLLTSV